MRLRNTPESWGAVAKLLHWAGAALIFVMLGLGLTMVHAHLSSGSKFEAYQLHKSTGFLVLAVTLARLLWRMANTQPAAPRVSGLGSGGSRVFCTTRFLFSSWP